MPSNAYLQFVDLMKNNPESLLKIHGKLQQGPGRRHNTDALNRSSIVILISSWQSYIEKVALETMTCFKPSSTTGVEAELFRMRLQIIKSEIGKFSTPGPTQIRSLFKNTLGIDPRKHWSLSYTCEHTNRRSTYSKAETEMMLSSWLKIRHAIAHGNELPDSIPWLMNSASPPRPSIRLNIVREGICFFHRLACATDSSIIEELANEYSIDAGW